MTKEQKAQAFEYGQKAFCRGIKCAPALDQAFLKDMIAGLQVGEGLPLYGEWMKGWTQENLKG